MQTDLNQELANVKKASRGIADLGTDEINNILLSLADAVAANAGAILGANKKDLSKMDESDPKHDRLKLTSEHLGDIASGIRNIASLPSPLGRVLEERTLESGLRISKVSVPLGVVGLIYEARPNVTFDAFALCFKSGNACVLKGGSDARHSNESIANLIRGILSDNGADPDSVLLLPPGRESVTALLNAADAVDVIIPRGGRKLIDFVRDNAKAPVIETGAGIVHIYVDASADTEKAKDIVMNAKTQRPSVCNALDTLIIHKEKLDELPVMALPLANHNVVIFADERSFNALSGKYGLLEKATEDHFGMEFLSLKMSIKTVENMEEALKHIEKHSSRHSEAIISEDGNAIERFLKKVDAACVIANASTRFTDGSQFGLGAEIGISTQKLHARGPLGIRELTSYKWIVVGNGQIRT